MYWALLLLPVSMAGVAHRRWWGRCHEILEKMACCLGPPCQERDLATVGIGVPLTWEQSLSKVVQGTEFPLESRSRVAWSKVCVEGVEILALRGGSSCFHKPLGWLLWNGCNDSWIAFKLEFNVTAFKTNSLRIFFFFFSTSEFSFLYDFCIGLSCCAFGFTASEAAVISFTVGNTKPLVLWWVRVPCFYCLCCLRLDDQTGKTIKKTQP